MHAHPSGFTYTQTFSKNWIQCWFVLLNWNQVKSRKVKPSLPWPCQPHLQDSGAAQRAGWGPGGHSRCHLGPIGQHWSKCRDSRHPALMWCLQCPRHFSGHLVNVNAWEVSPFLRRETEAWRHWGACPFHQREGRQVALKFGIIQAQSSVV